MLQLLVIGLGVGMGVGVWKNVPPAPHPAWPVLYLLVGVGLVAAYFAGRSDGRARASAVAVASAEATAEAVAASTSTAQVVVNVGLAEQGAAPVRVDAAGRRAVDGLAAPGGAVDGAQALGTLALPATTGELARAARGLGVLGASGDSAHEGQSNERATAVNLSLQQRAADVFADQLRTCRYEFVHDQVGPHACGEASASPEGGEPGAAQGVALHVAAREDWS